jgi:hypothetical protein
MIIAGSSLAVLVSCGPGSTPVATTPVPSIGGVVETASAMASQTASAAASPSGAAQSDEPTPGGSPGAGDGMTHMPAVFTIDLELPPSFQWAWDDSSYQAILDALDPARRAAVEAVGPPMTKYWLDVYAVDTTSAPLPSGSLTMLYTKRSSSRWATIEELEAAARSQAMPAGTELVGVERLDAPAGPLVRGILRIPIDVSQAATGLSTLAGTEPVGLVQYSFLSAGSYGLNLDTFAFIIPVDAIDSRLPALDEIMKSLRLRADPGVPTPSASRSPTP